jgi:TonB-dependent starch-binding outer membrane protein SusC
MFFTIMRNRIFRLKAALLRTVSCYFFKSSRSLIFQMLRVMRLTAMFLIICSFVVSARSTSQTITYSGKKVSLQSVFKVVEKQTGYSVFYDKSLLKNAKPVSVEAKNLTIENFLEEIFRNQALVFEIENKTVVVSEKPFLTQGLNFGLKGNRFSNIITPPITVSGRVVDEKGEPIVGATVTVKGSKKATSTDVDGSFSINAIIGDVLIISNIGFNQREIKVAVNDVGEINLIIANAELNEVVVNKGYYQTKRELETGNVARVSAKEISQQPVSNPLAALQGRVPGLEIAQNSGVPGASFAVQIRGRSSVDVNNVTNDPLYIIDGVQYPSQLPNSSSNSSGGGSLNSNLRGGNPLNFLNVADIESIDVLKDADATAIYGSRGASGVILITTKKAKSGESKVDLNFYSGFGKPTNVMKLLSTEQYLEMRREAFKNDGVTIPTTPDIDVPDLTIWNQNKFTNWQKLLFNNTARYNDFQGSISGGTSKSGYKFGVGYHNESTPFVSSGEDRKISANLNMTTKAFNDRLTATVTTTYTNDKNNISPVEFISLYTLPPNAPDLYNSDGSYNWAPITPGTIASFQNPLAEATRTYLGKNGALISSMTLTYEIIPNLIVRTAVGYNNFRTDEVTTTPTTTHDPSRLATFISSASYLNSSNSSWLAEPQINYNRSFGLLRLSGLIGSTFQENRSDFASGTGQGYSDDNFLSNPQAARSYSNGGFFTKQYKYNALYGRFNINYNDKYLLNLTGRRDGTTRFGPANQWANFAAAGLAWVFSKEAFTRNAIPSLSFGKLRMSYGSTGNDQLPDYLYLNLYSNDFGSYNGLKGVAPGRLFNPYLQWEITKKLEAGTELGFLDDKINFSAVYYRNRSGNQLLNTALPYTSGFVSISTNIPALVENSGWEFTFLSNNIQKKGFKWSTSANISLPKNKLVEFDGLENTTFKDVYIVGQPISSKRVYRTDGVDPNTGLLKMLNKDGVVTLSTLLTPKDQTIVINTAPTMSAGLSNNLSYKGFELNFFVQYVKKKSLAVSPRMPGFLFNVPEDYLDRWQRPGDIAKYPKFTQSFNNYEIYNTYDLTGSGRTDIAWENGSYLRLKNVAIAWNFSSKITKKIGLNYLRVYGQGQNLLTFTRYKGFDPETVNLAAPPMKIFTVGFQTSF